MSRITRSFYASRAPESQEPIAAQQLETNPPSHFVQVSSVSSQPGLPSDAGENTSNVEDIAPGLQTHQFATYPAFQYNASLHPYDTRTPQAHPTINTHGDKPTSAELKVQTGFGVTEPNQSFLPAAGKAAVEIHRRPFSSTANLPTRTPSIEAALAATQHTGASLSPSSALSSPGLGPFVDMTPLPSPLTAGSLWPTMANMPQISPPNSDCGSSPGIAEAEPISFARTSPQKRKTYQGLISAATGTGVSNPHVTTTNAFNHARNRSLSEYVPGGTPVPRSRNTTISGSQTAINREPPQCLPMHREQYLAVQRGISSLPIPRPPTPPCSNRSGTDGSDQESPPSSPSSTLGISKRPLPLSYEARTIRTGKLKRWTAIRQLGKGTFSTVMLATSEDIGRGNSENRAIDMEQDVRIQDWVNPKSLVAVKICEHGPAGGADEKKIETSLKRELEILKAIHHPSLVHLKAVNVLNERAFLVLNYSAGGDLFELASLKLDLLTPSLIRRIFAELIGAVKHLHSQYIVHRDIKLENVLVNPPTEFFRKTNDWQTYASPIITLTDLGLGRWIPRPPESPLLNTRCGSEDYAAPELLMGQEYDGRSTDGWALGVLLYALMEGRLPFDPIPGAKRQSPRSHRIARCEWSWVKLADGDGEWDPVKGEELEGGRVCVEGLLKRAKNRWSLDKVAEVEWVKVGMELEGGLKMPLSTTTARRKDQSGSRQLNKTSQHVTQPKSQGASQAMLYATGLEPSDMSKAQVGISSVWYSGNPCNMHLLDLNNRVKEGVERSGLIGYQFNTVGVSDAISMGTKGMRYSLQSRDLIADSIETVMGGQWYDANISIPGCDKNMPGVIMAMGRVNRPSLMVYGGTIKPGCAVTQDNASIDIVSAFQAYGQFITGEISEDQRFDIIRHACPGGGACGGMYTANTMATAIEVMGMTLPGSSSNPAESKAKNLECLAAGGAIKKLLTEDIRPTDILTRQAFENAMVVVNITGGSTNAVLHLIAIADSVGVKLTIDDFQSVSDRVPFLANLKPSGKYVMADLHTIGGTPALLKFLLKEGLIDGSGMTVTGQTLAKNLESAPDFPSDQDIIRPLSNPIKETGHIQILRGSLAPGGCVGKITGKEGLKFVGKAKVYDSEDDMILALEQGQIKKGEKTVVVIRYEGPKGGPGMPEMLKPSSAIMGAGLGGDVALITDGRFSGGSHGFLIGHIVPEAQEGGPIGLVRDGDEVIIDAEQRRLDLRVEEAELERRRKEFVTPPPKYEKGTLKKYTKLVQDASHGCITDG
ncbi:MAG: hypothetical protein Q9187_001303 [Circinaria calcarea]